MKCHFLRAITIALVTLLLGSSIYYLTNLETTLGLDTLFRIRGQRPPPAEVVVVAMDEASENQLGVGQDLTRWRGFHAQLIQELQRQGAALIVFDLQFIASHPDHDPAFAAAMREAGNVLVTDCVQKLRRGVEDFFGRDECSEKNKEPFVQRDGGQQQQLSEQLIALRKIPPTPVLVQSVLDHAPFYLSNDAESSTVHEGWTFLDTLAETPTLPVLTWLYYLQRTGALQGITQPDTPFSVWLTEQRRQCLSTPGNTSKSLPKKSDLENRIDKVVCLNDSLYLDFYGPPKTLRMESYSDVYYGKVVDLEGKVLFIGKANRKFSSGKTDYLQTPFSDTRSGKMAGVEIMATQFANLLEGRFVESPFPPGLALVMFGLVVGLLLTWFAGLFGIAASLLAGSAYVGLAVWYFSRSSMWLPVAVPVLIQLPLAWLISLLWSRRDLLNERKRILAFVRRVFPKWLPFVPASPGQWYPEKGAAVYLSQRDIVGLCLATDIEGYTSVAAHHTAHEMWELLNAYYQVLGHPVSFHDGIIADVTGDSMIAVWIDFPVANQRFAACLTALEMQLAVEQFNQTSSTGLLPTRIGLHEGDMTLGRLDAGEVSHYRAIGDTINTASRIQGVNKFLGTHILASAEIVASLINVIYRPVGSFRLVGRDEPVELMEIVGKETDVNVANYAKYEQFACGLSAFKQGQWEDAVVSFQTLLDIYGHDGPTNFYLDLALAYRETPPQGWEGFITLDAK
ncbi:MAG: adenylate/guanylate cyclase domain-containing protein [Methylococcales bacterium]|nr:adenylate/guanylate cyclase domain-containing protein [Methylococcales bacterium]